ncbi:MAG: NAD(P)/FAD-dependent oxidoreductase [Flavobacteriaceae bacterium]|nr:NAD(P)/FAD-dependent oxidoreductase [Flavobacteriaceae bacterium]
MKKIIIIGGGASGFFAAANIDSAQYEVIILEQNSDVLQKVKISGGGRCNVSHACFEPKELVQFYPRGSKELLSVFSKFQPADTMNWFEERGVDLKIEDDQRIFPQSNSSQSIINALIKECEKKNVKILTKQSVTEIIPQEERYKIHTTNQNYIADIVIFSTGSSPKAFKMLGNLGHKIIPPVPSLFTFNIKNDLLQDLMGTSFPMAEIEIPQLKLSEAGALLITHWGLSGPAVLKLSAWGARELAQLKYQFDIIVNFLGIHSETALEILKEFKENEPKKSIGQAKIFDITQRFWQRILFLAKIDATKQVAHLTQKEMKNITALLCENLMKVSGKSTFKEEFVTAGGVDLREVNFKTMQSKILPNFYISGEVLNIDAITGGFNFQACWSEAWLIAQDLMNKNP